MKKGILIKLLHQCLLHGEITENTKVLQVATRGCTRSTRVEQESLAKITRTK